MKLIPLDYIKLLHQKNIARTGGETGILNKHQLEALPDQLLMYISFAKPTILDVASWYLQRLVQNHYFVDGNKRVAITTCALFLEINDYDLVDDKNDELFDFIRKIATGELSELAKIKEQLKEYLL